MNISLVLNYISIFHHDLSDKKNNFQKHQIDSTPGTFTYETNIKFFVNISGKLNFFFKYSYHHKILYSATSHI